MERNTLNSFRSASKFHKAREVAMELATLTSEVGMDEYHDHLALLRLLKDKWANGENVTLTCGDTGIYVVYIPLF